MHANTYPPADFHLSAVMTNKRCVSCKQEVEESNFVGNQCKDCHAAYLESLGGEDQYSS
ncbi:hypothetical protein NTE_02482 [Candidatus Nitrososphaera evergladensis SR1]|jgi:Zn finger protein HypA/HybF involved in hydrogenase expression|uniref:Uncharacterized protein n=1 Tax=Candidatus Nitrososphaera evergladensis SR1 TaxID=1459636 RepID=A0A075MSH4_9ARCH|nr:hypothetical protein [Candidatus Nitrososphaera evergladensis]AIF84531.1 hypothetical protein NTE_02482 [Candidatus Nitrososphaera evergladensis SR1]